MAAIDKCYLSSYDDYLALKEWMDDKEFITPRGCKVVLKDYLVRWKKELFDCLQPGDGGLPVFNTPVYVDNYLYHNCPLPFIQDWLADRYLNGGYSKGTPEDIQTEPSYPDYESCTRVKILRKGLGNHPMPTYWWVDVIDDTSKKKYREYCGYNEEKDYWLCPGENDVWTCSTALMKCSVRSIIRKIIRNWKLPKGMMVQITGRDHNDVWLLRTK